MGGAVFEFPIVPSADILERARHQRIPLLRRLFRKSPAKNEETLHLEQVLAHVPRQLIGNFKAWLARAMPNPWEATETVIRSYLRLVGPSAVTLAHRAPDRAQDGWVVNFRLSGCAGMAECSSWLISHWLQIWFERNRERLQRELLSPSGLTIGTGEAEGMISVERFLPVGAYGYAVFHPDLADTMAGETEDEREFGPFELDAAVDETDSRKGKAAREFLQARFTDLMRDGRCRCQLCMPEFDLKGLETMPV